MKSFTDYSKDEQRTIKAFVGDIAFVNERAKAYGCSAAELIHKMCEEMRKRSYLEELDESFALLSSGDKKYQEILDDEKAWDVTAIDGLNNAP
ncbi:MAG: hypothetical protein KGS72_14710 [Cyanobacteria bacterium REEB67]|nr:hypothetical protein [Cyanobacteria bacterium REEB67]